MWNSYTKFILHFLQTLSKTTEMFRKLRVMASALKRLLLVLNLFLYKGEKSSSKSSLSGHSRKQTALLTATFTKPCFSQPPMIQALYFYIPINGQLQLQTPFHVPRVSVVVNFLFQLIFIFPLFWGMVMYANEFKTKEKQKLTEIKN